jgi:hypothetical protein
LPPQPKNICYRPTVTMDTHVQLTPFAPPPDTEPDERTGESLASAKGADGDGRHRGRVQVVAHRVDHGQVQDAVVEGVVELSPAAR